MSTKGFVDGCSGPQVLRCSGPRVLRFSGPRVLGSSGSKIGGCIEISNRPKAHSTSHSQASRRLMPNVPSTAPGPSPTSSSILTSRLREMRRAWRGGWKSRTRQSGDGPSNRRWLDSSLSASATSPPAASRPLKSCRRAARCQRLSQDSTCISRNSTGCWRKVNASSVRIARSSIIRSSGPSASRTGADSIWYTPGTT